MAHLKSNFWLQHCLQHRTVGLFISHVPSFPFLRKASSITFKTCFAVVLRTEFKAYKDVKPVKRIKAPSQYKPPGEETSLETSYSATYKGEQVKPQATDNKLLERRRIRTLYSEPGKGPIKVREHHLSRLGTKYHQSAVMLPPR